ncbi:MAG: sulfite exporter TauE/SafE family protein [Magnetococcales bacterium]|nr:sulfite exporter TauE/SafE family protein [Magnetococcales bacterium]
MDAMYSPSMLLMGVLVLLGATVQGSVGFGFGLVVAPVAMLVLPELVPGSVTFVSLVITLILAIRERKTMGRPTGLFWILLGLLPGYWLGSRALLLLPPGQMAYFFGGMVLVAVGISFSGVRIHPQPVTLMSAGLLTGIMSITTTMGGPPQAIALQELPGPRLRGTLAISFTIGSLISLSMLHAIQRFGSVELWYGLRLLPFAILGIVLSAPLAHWLDRGGTRIAVLLLAALAGMVVIVRQYFFATP